MNNFDHAIEATDTALNSMGSAAQENARVMEGLEAKKIGLAKRICGEGLRALTTCEGND